MILLAWRSRPEGPVPLVASRSEQLGPGDPGPTSLLGCTPSIVLSAGLGGAPSCGLWDATPVGRIGLAHGNSIGPSTGPWSGTKGAHSAFRDATGAAGWRSPLPAENARPSRTLGSSEELRGPTRSYPVMAGRPGSRKAERGGKAEQFPCPS